MTAPSAISLNRPLAKFAAACLPKIRLAPAAGEILLNFGLSDSRRPDQPVLHHVAGDRRDHQHQERHAERRRAAHIRALCASASRPGPSVWIIQELAIRLRSGIRMPPPIEPEKVDSTSVAAGDHEPGVDLLALGDVAALMRVVETFLRRVFCFVGVSSSSAIAQRFQLSGIRSCMTPMK